MTTKTKEAKVVPNPLTAFVERWAPPAVLEFYNSIPTGYIHTSI